MNPEDMTDHELLIEIVTTMRAVAEALKAKGISSDRIAIDFKGDTVQPYSTPKENRVSICIAE